jgi:hypothetical protein
MLSDEVLNLAPDVAISVLTRQSEGELLTWIEEGTVQRAVVALRHLDADTAGRLIEEFPAKRRADVIAAMEPRDAFRCLRTIPRRRRETLVGSLPPAVKREAERILRVREDSAAALMEIQPLHVTTHTHVAECLARVRNCQTRLPRTLFVVDAEDMLVGAIDLQALIAAASDALIGTLMHPIKWQVDEFTTREEIAAGIGRFNVNTLPVVNLQGRFSGIIRSENLFDAVEQDALSDLQTMVGAGKDEHALSTVWTTVQKRHPWLQINLLTAFLAASVVGLFEHTIAQVHRAGRADAGGRGAIRQLRFAGAGGYASRSRAARDRRERMAACRTEGNVRRSAEWTRHRGGHVAVGLRVEQVAGPCAGHRTRDGRVDDHRRHRWRVHSDHDEPFRPGSGDQLDHRADDHHRRLGFLFVPRHRNAVVISSLAQENFSPSFPAEKKRRNRAIAPFRWAPIEPAITSLIDQ